MSTIKPSLKKKKSGTVHPLCILREGWKSIKIEGILHICKMLIFIWNPKKIGIFIPEINSPSAKQPFHGLHRE